MGQKTLLDPQRCAANYPSVRTHLGASPSTVFSVRVAEASELIAADLFRNADENRYRITFGDVERHLAMLANHVPGCSCGRCPLVSRVSAQRVYAIASDWRREVRATRVRAMRLVQKSPIWCEFDCGCATGYWA